MTRMAMDMPFVIMARSYSIQINLTQTQMALLIDDIKCPFVHNVDQRDSDGDSRGDACDCPRCPFDLLLTTVHNVAILPCPDDDDDEPPQTFTRPNQAMMTMTVKWEWVAVDVNGANEGKRSDATGKPGLVEVEGGAGWWVSLPGRGAI
eukprot:427975_1